MIKLTRYDGSAFYVNADFIEFIETTPDTVLSLIDHKKILVRESAQNVLDLIIDYYTRITPHIPATLTAMARWGAMHYASTEEGALEHDATLTEGGRG